MEDSGWARILVCRLCSCQHCYQASTWLWIRLCLSYSSSAPVPSPVSPTDDAHVPIKALPRTRDVVFTHDGAAVTAIELSGIPALQLFPGGLYGDCVLPLDDTAIEHDALVMAALPGNALVTRSETRVRVRADFRRRHAWLLPWFKSCVCWAFCFRVGARFVTGASVVCCCSSDLQGP